MNKLTFIIGGNRKLFMISNKRILCVELEEITSTTVEYDYDDGEIKYTEYVDIPLYAPTKTFAEDKRQILEAYAKDCGDFNLEYVRAFLVQKGKLRGMFCISRKHKTFRYKR